MPRRRHEEDEENDDDNLILGDVSDRRRRRRNHAEEDEDEMNSNIQDHVDQLEIEADDDDENDIPASPTAQIRPASGGSSAQRKTTPQSNPFRSSSHHGDDSDHEDAEDVNLQHVVDPMMRKNQNNKPDVSKPEQKQPGQVKLISSMTIEEKRKELYAPIMNYTNVEHRLELWYDVWARFPMNNTEFNNRLSALYDLENVINPDTVSDTYQKYNDALRTLKRQLQIRGVIAMDPSEMTAPMQTMIEKLNYVTKNLKYAYDNVQRSIQIRQPRHCGKLFVGLNQISGFDHVDYSELTDYHELQLQLLEKADQYGYAKIGSDVYQEVRTDKGFPTRSWKFIMDMPTFVRRCAYPMEQNFKLWLNLFKHSGMVNNICNTLSETPDSRFPTLERDRTVFSFRNGIYVCREDKFVLYDSYEFQTLPNAMVAAKYFDRDFENDKYEEEMRKYGEDKKTDRNRFLGINIPSLQAIMDTQKWPDGVRAVYFVAGGKMIYPLCEKDNWQVIPVMYGMAGTGKSTTLDVYSRLYLPSDTYFMSNRVSRQFPLEGLIGRLIWLATDIKDDWGLDQMIFNRLVEGSHDSIERKGKPPLPTKHTTPGGVACNSLPGYTNHGNNFVRRLLLFFFSELVAKGNSFLGREIDEQMPAIIKAFNVAYREWTLLYGQLLFTDIPELDPKFKAWRNIAQLETSPLAQYIESDAVVLDVKEGTEKERICYWMPLDEFETNYRTTMKLRGVKDPRFNETLYKTVFPNYGIKIVLHKNGTKWIKGICVRESKDNTMYRYKLTEQMDSAKPPNEVESTTTKPNKPDQDDVLQLKSVHAESNMVVVS